jgi:hypothetical protein
LSGNTVEIGRNNGVVPAPQNSSVIVSDGISNPITITVTDNVATCP